MPGGKSAALQFAEAAHAAMAKQKQMGEKVVDEAGFVFNAKGNVDVNPAEGYTPAQAAKELRTIIRGWIKFSSGGGPTPDIANMHKKHLENWKMCQKYQQKLNTLFKEMNDVVTTRKVGDIRKKQMEILNMQNKLYASAYGMYNTGNYLFNKGGVQAPNLEALKIAYSLVQVIPTVEAPTTERAATTIRAITAILKVFYGVDVDATMEKLPDMMGPLLKQISAAKHEEEKATVAVQGQISDDDYYEEDEDD